MSKAETQAPIFAAKRASSPKPHPITKTFLPWMSHFFKWWNICHAEFHQRTEGFSSTCQEIGLSMIARNCSARLRWYSISLSCRSESGVVIGVCSFARVGDTELRIGVWTERRSGGHVLSSEVKLPSTERSKFPASYR